MQWEGLFRQTSQNSLLDVRVLITAFVALSVLTAVLLAWRTRPRLQERMPNQLANVIIVGSFATFLALAGVTLLFLWERVDSTLVFLNSLEGSEGIALDVVSTLAVLAVAYVVSGFTRQAVERVTRRHEAFTQHQSRVFYRVSQVSVYVVAVGVILGVWDVDLTGLLVGAGFLGVVVGMAARQTLGALLAGFVLMFSRPFEIGDWVEIDEDEGIVTDISVVNTRIQTFDGEFVMIPNDVVTATTIVNRSRKGRLRLEVDVGIDYDADVERASELATEAMKEVDDVLAVPSPQVVTKELGDSAVLLGLRFWIDKPSARRKWRARTAVIGAVKRAFDREGVKIPYPQRELTGREEADGLRISRERERQREIEASADGGKDGRNRERGRHRDDGRDREGGRDPEGDDG